MKHFNAHFSSTINIEYFVKQLFIFYYNQIIDKDAPLTISVRHIDLYFNPDKLPVSTSDNLTLPYFPFPP